LQPPAAICPDEHRSEYTFDRYGVRVPTILISPYLDARVDHTIYDHTSVLKYLTNKWGLGPLGERVAQANDFGRDILPKPRHDCIQKIEVQSVGPACTEQPFNGLQKDARKLLKRMVPLLGKESLTPLTEKHSNWTDFTDVVQGFMNHEGTDV
jgi:hypothetical protein